MLALKPNPDDSRLTETLSGFDHNGAAASLEIVTERALTLYLNSREVITMMALGDYPEQLAIGFLLNQNMLNEADTITDVDYDDELGVIVVRTASVSNYEQKLKKQIRTSGCAQGTLFGDIMEKFNQVHLNNQCQVRTSWIYALVKQINACPSLYRKAGAIHGCALCEQDQLLAYVEDIGRHNAVDKIAGFMYLNKVAAQDKIFYTTGRLTTEMIIKTVQMEIPVLISRSGFTAAAVALARQAKLTLIGRLRGKRFVVLSGEERLIYDTDPETVVTESKTHQRKASLPLVE